MKATGWAQESLAFLHAAVQLLHMRGAMCRCTVLLEHKVVTRHSAYLWQQYDVIMTSSSSIEEISDRYHQNFLLCNKNEITTCTGNLFYSFCEKVYAVAFFKVVQQQTISEVENSITYHTCGQIIYVCNSEKIIKIRQYLRKLYSNEKGSSFFDSQCI